MKKLILVFLLLTFVATGYTQAKKPSIMVVPSDVWCNANGYMLEFDNQGSLVKVPDYKRAFQENADLVNVISKINEMMASRGFPLQNLESALKTLENESAEDALLAGKTSAASISESPIDRLKKTAKADIWMQLTWKVNPSGFKNSITFTLQGLDAYTDKQIAGASGTGNPLSGAPLPVLLETAVLSHIDNFNVQLLAHFDDLFANGREITLRIKKFDSFLGDLESEFEGIELSEQISNWVSENTVKGNFNETNATENAMLFIEVRIPLVDNSGKKLDTRTWAKGLQKFLKEKFQIDSKLMTKGLGQATIVIGEK